jgi:membrane fusion protein (multidrug efflux system)
MKYTTKKHQWRFVAAASALTLLAACKNDARVEQAAPPEVGVITVSNTPMPVFSDLPGRTNPFLISEVRARVDGIVTSREFTEGQDVAAGQTLYKIDPAPYVAALNNAKAALARSQASFAAQNSQRTRYEELVQANAISKQNYDDALAAHGQAVADVAAAKAMVAQAEINLGYTDVKSPISGRIGLSEVTVGAYVRSTDATLMATVQQLDPMYVDLTQSSADGLELRTDIQEGRLQASGTDAAQVELFLENGKRYGEVGKLQLSDVSVDQGTGSVRVRAVIPNSQKLLLPGMFVRARLAEGVNANAMLVPQVGITHDQRGRPVALLVDGSEKVTRALLTTAGTRGTDWVVTAGIKPGDRVVVQGTEKATPGIKVNTVPAALPASTAGSTAGSKGTVAASSTSSDS